MKGHRMTSSLGARAPKYHRIADALRRDISDGTFAPGQTLPAETALAERFEVSVPTMRHALAQLRAEGIIESQHGIGTFVKIIKRLERNSRRRYPRARVDRQLLTSHLRHQIVEAGRAPAPDHVARAMGISPGSEVVLRRRHLFNKETGKPEELGASYLPVSIAGGTFLEQRDVTPQALFLCMEELSGKRYTTARDEWTARLPTGDEAAFLDLATGAAVMHVMHVARADDGSVLEVSESTWPADRIVISDEYEIAAEADANSPSPSDI
jgi:GntR family transcriptional regulator